MSYIPALYQLFLKHGSVTTDSRQAGRGVIFFALRGERFNGNDFALQALAAGSPCAVVDDPALKGTPGIFCVDEVLLALQRLASFHRRQLGIPILAITGTNGKTTTKELIHAVLSQEFPVCATPGNLNNHIGVPLTLLSMDASTRIGIVEMGANHPGEIARLCEIATPTHGLITNIGKAHLEGFGGFEGVVRTKNELYLALDAPGSTLFVNGANPLLMGLLAHSKASLVTYGNHRQSLCNLSETESAPFLTATWNQHTLRTSMAGGYNLENMEAACAVGLHFGISEAKIVAAISGYKPQNSRSQWVETARNRVLCDYYNANPSSMSIALDHFFRLEIPLGMQKRVLLGDMFELGDATAQEHSRVIDMLGSHPEVEAWLAGVYFSQALSDPWSHIRAFSDTEAMVRAMNIEPFTQSVVLIKGSRGMRMEQLMPHL